MSEQELRIGREPIFLKEMYAHEGKCLFCPPGMGIVKMLRENAEPYRLRPNQCFCISCGQRYFMKIEDIDKWDHEQWKQKQKTHGCVSLT